MRLYIIVFIHTLFSLFPKWQAAFLSADTSFPSRGGDWVFGSNALEKLRVIRGDWKISGWTDAWKNTNKQAWWTQYISGNVGCIAGYSRVFALLRLWGGGRREGGVHYCYVKPSCLGERHVMKDAVMHLLRVTSPNSDLQWDYTGRNKAW